ncbi:fungal specific transcription factor domain-containing protein [Aspergillus saccharolyticus JOP 1030-1]|uniref:Xylanolytic transcriptional activator regulatory domain-containing protein n=1 Tax=Aspergillus saccharolyticus JOP 1030-1 TaxID=1450539 RepID=A0A318Z7M0_9EURO|nr:hypothetical protein BP01DRAFT_303297 [Aspergillus saccharolyticus JOP 1030-1]PYH42417.1 hypothetical protein BP01DRAFT_303297 [Aspergillus saccharolyticus JOP 1030-1]
MINHLEGKLERLETHLNSIFNVGELSPIPDTPPPGETGPPALASTDPGSEDFDDSETEDPSAQQEPASASLPLNPVVPSMHGQYTAGILGETPCFYIPRCISDTGAGCNSGFSVSTEEGLDWVSRKAGPSHLDLLLGSMTSVPELTTFLPPRKLFGPFPRGELLTQLLQDYMEYFNVTFPIFTRAEIDSLFADNYADPQLHGPGRWTSIQVILAVAYLLPGSRGQPDHQVSALFMKGAMQTINELLLAPPDLWACKSIVVMAVGFLAMAAGHPCSSLISIAVQISNQLGLGKTAAQAGLSPDQVQHQRLLFWMVCAVDIEISYRFGLPPAQKEDIVGEAAPIDSPSSAYSVPIKDESGTFNLFDCSVELVQIRSQIIRQLYLTSAANQSFDQLLAVAGDFDQRLQTWLKKIPYDYRPDAGAPPPFRNLPGWSTLLFIHYTYYDCMIAIHSLIAMRGVDSAQDLISTHSPPVLAGFSNNPRVLLSTSLTSRAARASLALMKYLPADDIHLGIAYHYPSVAMKTLASSIIRSPRPAAEVYSLRMLYQAESYLSQKARDSPLEAIRRLWKVCTDCCAVAQRAVDSA